MYQNSGHIYPILTNRLKKIETLAAMFSSLGTWYWYQATLLYDLAEIGLASECKTLRVKFTGDSAAENVSQAYFGTALLFHLLRNNSLSAEL